MGLGVFIVVGYVDLGNWVIFIVGGLEFGYILLFVILIFNILVVLL